MYSLITNSQGNPRRAIAWIDSFMDDFTEENATRTIKKMGKASKILMLALSVSPWLLECAAMLGGKAVMFGYFYTVPGMLVLLAASLIFASLFVCCDKLEKYLLNEFAMKSKTPGEETPLLRSDVHVPLPPGVRKRSRKDRLSSGNRVTLGGAQPWEEDCWSLDCLVDDDEYGVCDP
jgi:hypothetical protein